MISAIVYPGQPVPNAQPAPSQQPEPVERVPPAVAVAMGFVQMANDYMGPRCFVHHRPYEGESHNVVEVELHPKQNAAFECACNLLGVYFDSEIERIERERLLEAAEYAEEIFEAGQKLGLEQLDEEYGEK